MSNPYTSPVLHLPDAAAQLGFDLTAVPFVGRVLLEQLVRTGEHQLAAVLGRRLAAGLEPDVEIPFRPARILMQDYTGIPLLVDLAALRDHVARPEELNPALPVDVVCDHSIQTDHAGLPSALADNEALDMIRNRERYAFLKWAEAAFEGVRVIPPGHGIVHQVNLEQLATVVTAPGSGVERPDTLIGTDSHTTMVNGIGVLGWGVGGLEATAVMLGLAGPMHVPPVIGVRLLGEMPPTTSSTDVVLSITERLRREGVRGMLVEFTGPGVATLRAADRCTIANMAPEYGAMTGFFPVDEETLDYLHRTGRSAAEVRRVRAYVERQGLLDVGVEPRFGRVVEFDLSAVGPTLAGPSRPDQTVSLADLRESFDAILPGPPRAEGPVCDGDLAIASITSCTSTSNPISMLSAGLLARYLVERGAKVPQHVKTSLSPGSRAVTRYLEASGLLADLEQLGFAVTGYGCMTCNGGSGPLEPLVEASVQHNGVEVAAVLSGNRNFEARVHPQVRASYLASPALVVAMAVAGTVRTDLDTDPLCIGSDGEPVYLRDVWPRSEEVRDLERRYVLPDVFSEPVPARGTWADIPTYRTATFGWDDSSSYIRPPAYVEGGRPPEALTGARVLVALGDDVSTDHISPVGPIARRSPAGRYLTKHGEQSLNSFGSRRGNHEVMARGVFTNPRLVNRLLGEGPALGRTRHLPSGEVDSVFAVASRYAESHTPLVVLAGRSYGMGSSRDWAAKGPWLLGVRAVLAESFERIHRANLCAMGIVPLLLPDSRSWADVGLTGHETLALDLRQAVLTGRTTVVAGDLELQVVADVHTTWERETVLRGGTLPTILSRVRQQKP